MTIHEATPHSVEESRRRVVKVSSATIAAAKAQVALSNKLGVPVPPAVAKIARVR